MFDWNERPEALGEVENTTSDDINWLEVYDKWAVHIHDDILDDADEKFNIGDEPGQTMDCTEEYFIYCAQRWMTRLRYDCK